MEDSVRNSALNFIAKLHPLCELSDEQRSSMLKGAWLERLSPETTLFADSDHRWFTYVIEGEIALHSDKGDGEVIASGSPRSRLPLFKIHPRDLCGESRSGCSLLRFDKRRYQEIKASNMFSVEADEMVLSSEARTGEHFLFDHLYHAYRTDKLEVPSLPEAALRVRQAVEDPNISLKEVAKLLHIDPALSARLVQVANSAAYSRGQHVETLYDAVSRLGLEATHNLTVAFSLKHLFEAQQPWIKERLARLYHHSTLIASLSYVLARENRQLNPERALLAGLLHDLGEIPILLYADRNPELFKDETALDINIERLRGLIGNMVLNRMGFDAEMIAVAEGAEQWLHSDGEQADYRDLVVLAHLHSQLGLPEMHDLPRIDETPAYQKLRPGEFDPLTGLEQLNRARHIATALQASLH